MEIKTYEERERSFDFARSIYVGLINDNGFGKYKNIL